MFLFFVFLLFNVAARKFKMPYAARTVFLSERCAAERGRNAVPETPSAPCAFGESTAHEARAKG